MLYASIIPNAIKATNKSASKSLDMTHAYTAIPITDPADDTGSSTGTCPASPPRLARRTCASPPALRILMSAGLILHQVSYILLDKHFSCSFEFMRILMLFFLIAVVIDHAKLFREMHKLFGEGFYYLMAGNALAIGGYARAHVWHWSVWAKVGLVAATFVVSCVWYGGCKWVLGKYAELVFDTEEVGQLEDDGEVLADVEQKEVKEKV